MFAFLNFGADGAARQNDMGVTHDLYSSSLVIYQYAVITEPSPVVCCLRMLIAFERVWAVGCFAVGRSLFVVPRQPTSWKM